MVRLRLIIARRLRLVTLSQLLHLMQVFSPVLLYILTLVAIDINSFLVTSWFEVQMVQPANGSPKGNKLRKIW